MLEKPIEITVLIGLDTESATALSNVMKACEVLMKNYKIKAFVNPVNLWLDPVKASIRNLPVIIIDNKKVLSGYVPTINELVNAVLESVKMRKRSNNEQHLYGYTPEENPLLNVAVVDW
jgi:hypothetical protein